MGRQNRSGNELPARDLAQLQKLRPNDSLLHIAAPSSPADNRQKHLQSTLKNRCVEMSIECGRWQVLDNRYELTKSPGLLPGRRSVTPKNKLIALLDRDINIFRHMTGMRREPRSQMNTSYRTLRFVVRGSAAASPITRSPSNCSHSFSFVGPWQGVAKLSQLGDLVRIRFAGHDNRFRSRQHIRV